MIRNLLTSSLFLSALLLTTLPAYSADSQKLEVVSDQVDPKQLSPTPALAWGRDPFEKRPGFALVEPEKEDFKLDGIYYSSRNPAAIINGNIVGPGDAIDQRYVKEIGNNFVLLENEDSIIEVSIPPVPENKKVMEISVSPDEVENDW